MQKTGRDCLPIHWVFQSPPFLGDAKKQVVTVCPYTGFFNTPLFLGQSRGCSSGRWPFFSDTVQDVIPPGKGLRGAGRHHQERLPVVIIENGCPNIRGHFRPDRGSGPQQQGGGFGHRFGGIF